jgi:S-adenosylmethionine-diacylgycerolhomoserine-N-methlytransferase
VSRARRLYRWHAPFYDVTRRPWLVDRELAVSELGIRPGDRVIDFACGTGLNLPRLRAAGAADVVGVDFTQEMLERARRRAPDARLELGDIRHHRVEGPPADRALCTYGLSIVPDWRTALDNIVAHLRPGGTLVVLDFHRMQGALRWADPALRAWFALFGVRPGLPLREALSGRFEACRVRVRHGGWNAVVTAAGVRTEARADRPF